MPCLDSKTIIQKTMGAVRCGDIFEADEVKVRKLYREWAKVIHPDICDEENAREAFSKLNLLYNKTLKLLAEKDWSEWSILLIPGMGPVKYLYSEKFELGKWYVTDDNLYYVLDDDKAQYINRYFHGREMISYPDRQMMDIFAPKIGSASRIDTNVIIFGKKKDQYPLGLFMQAMQGHLTGRDIAWMISRMADLCCFLQWNKVVLNGFCESSLLISPKDHALYLSGGWWYATKVGEKMTGTTKEIFELMPTAVRTSKLASTVTDLESIKFIARKLISCAKDVPAQIVNWAESGSGDNAITEYGRWNAALEAAYGKRHFQILEVEYDRIYRGGSS